MIVKKIDGWQNKLYYVVLISHDVFSGIIKDYNRIDIYTTKHRNMPYLTVVIEDGVNVKTFRGK